MAGETTPNTAPGVQFTTPGGGKVTGLGAFTYDPAAAYSGLDSFVYQLTDGDPVTPDRITTVIIDVSDIIWFVDNNAGTGGNGTFSSRFDALADVSGATGPDQ